VGWQAAYGDGEAVFGYCVLQADAIVLDGLVFDGDVSGWVQDGLVNLNSGSDNCQILNCTLRLGCNALLPSDEAYNIGIRVSGCNNTLISGTTVDGEWKMSMFLRDTGMIQLMSGSGNVVTNCLLINGRDIDVFKTFGGFRIVDCVITNFDNPKYSVNEHADVMQAYFGGPTGGVFERNFVNNFAGQLGNYDWYQSGVSYNYIIRNNVFANIGGTCFQGNPGFLWHNNVFYQVATFYGLGAIHLMNYNSAGNDHRYFGTEIRNNVFLQCGSSGDRSVSFDGSDSNIITHNYFGGSGYAAIGGQGTAFVNGGNPNFVNLAAADFRIASGSVLIDKGTTLPGFSTDRLGVPRPQGGAWDIGPHEFGSEPVNQAPSVNAGADVVFTMPTNTTTLVGSVSDPEGAPVTVTWSKVSGSGTVGFATPTAMTTIASFSQTGAYTLRLTASDGTNIVSDEVIVTLNPEPQPASASFEAESGSVTAPFLISGGVVSQSVESGVIDGGRAVYTFRVPASGNYLLVGTVNAPTSSENSLFVSINGEPADPYEIWDIPVTTGYEAREVSWRGNGTSDANEFAPKVFALSAGEHSLIVIGREPNVSLDRFEVFPATTPVPMPPTRLRVIAQDGP
jgi:hypothetical protein